MYKKFQASIKSKNLMNLMKPSSILINTSRGSIVDEKYLTEVLANKRIAGAGLDVFEQEPIDKNNPLLLMENVMRMLLQKI